MKFDDKHTPELDAKEVSMLEAARSWEDEEGGLSPLASSALEKLEQWALMFCRRLVGSTSPVLGERRVETNPHTLKWERYHFRVWLRARPQPRVPAGFSLTPELKKLGFWFQFEDSPVKSQKIAGIHSSLGGHAGDAWVDVEVQRTTGPDLEKRSEWLPKRVLHNLPDGSVFEIRPEQEGKRALYVFPRKAVANSSAPRGLWAPEARSWRTQPDDARVWPVIEAAQSASASWGSLTALIDRLGIPSWGMRGLPLEPGKQGLYEAAAEALDDIARAATRYQNPEQVGHWAYDFLGGTSFRWNHRDVTFFVVKAVPEAGIVIFQGTRPFKRLVTFTPEGDLLDPQNLRAQQEAFSAEVGKFWQKKNPKG